MSPYAALLLMLLRACYAARQLKARFLMMVTLMSVAMIFAMLLAPCADYAAVFITRDMPLLPRAMLRFR